MYPKSCRKLLIFTALQLLIVSSSVVLSLRIPKNNQITSSTNVSQRKRHHRSVVVPRDEEEADSHNSFLKLRGGDNSASKSSSSSDKMTESKLTKIRQTIFPIHGSHEVKKFLLIGSIKFFIIMALTLTRDTKDTLVVTQCGAEAIAFLKVRP